MNYNSFALHRGVAQLVERVVRDHEVVRSNRITPTIFHKDAIRGDLIEQ